jgi:zinc D-Ala-D-Ala carboxypeptidase
MNRAMKLSENFPLHEFLRSETAARMGRVLEPPPEAVAHLTRLSVEVLQPVHVLLGRPLYILSGWRPDWLNDQVGGAKDSAHLYGRAADTIVSGMSALVLARFIQRHNLPVDKCIVEFDQWVHVQVSRAPSIAPRRIYLTARRVNGKTIYSPGLG